MDACDELVESIDLLLTEFGEALDDFFANLQFSRAWSWEHDLSLFCSQWQQRGLRVTDASQRRLEGVIRDLRQDLVPAEELRGMLEREVRRVALRQASDEQTELDEPASPAEAANGEGMRKFGHGIMRRHPPGRWMFVVDDVLTSWEFTDEVRSAFRDWMALEAQRRFAESGDAAMLFSAESFALDEQLAFAPDAAEETPPQDANQEENPLPKARGLAADGGDLPFVSFDSYMENEGILYYEVNSEWWKVPVKKIDYEGDEVYDLRGAVKFEPTFVQKMLLSCGGALDDDGWEIIFRHYLESYGPAGYEQLVKDLASMHVDEAATKYVATQGPLLILSILFGKAAERVGKIASPVFRKSFAELQKRLRAVSKRSSKEARQVMEKELREVAAELRRLAEMETDALAKREAKQIADELEEEYKKGSQRLNEAQAELSPPPSNAGTEKKGGKYSEVRKENRGGEVHHMPAASISPYSRVKGPSIWMDSADHMHTLSWGRSAKAQAYRQQQADLIAQGKLREAIQMDIDDIRSTFGSKYDEHIKQMLQAFGFAE